MSTAGVVAARLVRGVAEAPTPSPNAPFFSDAFATGDLSKTENGAAWVGNTNCSVVSCDAIGLTRPPSNSAHAVQFRYPGPAGQFAQLDIALDQVGAGYTEIFKSYWLYFPNGLEGGTVGPAFVTPVGGVGFKQLRVFDTTTNGPRSWGFGSESYYPNGTTVDFTPTTASNHRMLLYTGGPGYYNSPGEILPISSGYDIPLGQWIKVGWHIRTNTVEGTDRNVGGDGILRLYINDVLRIETVTGTLTPNNARIRGAYMLGNNNAAFQNADTRVYLADYRVSTEGF